MSFRLWTAALIALAGLAAAVSASGQDAAGPIDPGAGEGTFTVVCESSHKNNDDPIVFPGQRGASHTHEYFGSRSTNAFSTNESIIDSAASTCQRDRPWQDTNRTAYWLPELRVDGQSVTATKLFVKYAQGDRDAPSIRPFPEGFRMIAGNAKGSEPVIPYRGQRVVRWHRTPDEAQLELRFPDCWDGHSLDSQNHQSHMAYSGKVRSGEPWRACPSSHPVPVPQVELHATYPAPQDATLTLSSGDHPATTHGDFMNGWNQDVLEGLVRRCMNPGEYCGGQDKPVVGHGPGI